MFQTQGISKEQGSEGSLQTETEQRQVGEYKVRIVTTRHSDVPVYLYPMGAISAYRDDYEYDKRQYDFKPLPKEGLVERKTFVTDRDGREVAYMIEDVNFGRVRPAFRNIYSYNPDGSKNAEYSLQYDAAGTVTQDHYLTFYESGNVKVIQTLVHEEGLTRKGHEKRLASHSYIHDREDINDAPIIGKKREVTGTDYLAEARDPNSWVAVHRRSVLDSFPPEMLDLVKNGDLNVLEASDKTQLDGGKKVPNLFKRIFRQQLS